MRKNKSSTIAFIIHPLSVSEFSAKSFFYSPFEVVVDLFLRNLRPQIIKEVYSRLPPHVFMKAELTASGWSSDLSFLGVMCPLFPDEILDKEKAIKKILSAVKCAINRGANVIVLGGFTSIVGNQGEEVRGFLKKSNSVVITSGNTFTAALCIEGLLKAAKILNKEISESTVAVVGATGDIGSICAKILAKEAKEIVLCSRGISDDIPLVSEIRKFSKAQVRTEPKANKAVKNADLILLATSSFVPLIDDSDIKPYSIIADVSLPHNISKDFLLKRPDVFVFDAGKTKAPVVSESFKWSRFALSRGIVHGCMAEGLLLALDNRASDFSIGRGNISEEKITEIISIAKKFGFELADFSVHGNFYEVKQLDDIQRAFLMSRGQQNVS